MRLGQTKEQIDEALRDPLGIERFKEKKRAEVRARLVKLALVFLVLRSL